MACFFSADDPVVEFVPDFQRYFEEYSLLMFYNICFKQPTSHLITLTFSLNSDLLMVAKLQIIHCTVFGIC